MPFEQFGDRRLAQTARRVRGRRGFPEFEQPFGAEVVLEFGQGREVAPELLAQAIGESVALGAEVLGRRWSLFSSSMIAARRYLSVSSVADGAERQGLGDSPTAFER